MKLGYFNYNGKVYASGTVIKIKPRRSKCNKFVEEVTFLWCIPGKNIYNIELEPGYSNGITEKDFYESILGIISTQNARDINEVQLDLNPCMRKPTFEDELRISGMCIVWIWYIFLMILLIFFKNGIVGWIGLTILFNKYRKTKIRKAGYKG